MVFFIFRGNTVIFTLSKASLPLLFVLKSLDQIIWSHFIYAAWKHISVLEQIIE